MTENLLHDEKSNKNTITGTNTPRSSRASAYYDLLRSQHKNGHYKAHAYRVVDAIGDAHERFSVGDEVLVRILSVRRNSLEDLGIKADIKSISENTDRDNLQKCRIQGKYAGRVTDVHKGVVYVRLSNGVNAVAHSCYDYRMPGKKDDVSFAVTRLDMERGVAVGIITRIIRQNL